MSNYGFTARFWSYFAQAGILLLYRALDEQTHPCKILPVLTLHCFVILSQYCEPILIQCLSEYIGFTEIKLESPHHWQNNVIIITEAVWHLILIHFAMVVFINCVVPFLSLKVRQINLPSLVLTKSKKSRRVWLKWKELEHVFIKRLSMILRKISEMSVNFMCQKVCIVRLWGHAIG